MVSEYSVMVSNKFAGLLVDEDDPSVLRNGPREKPKDEDNRSRDFKKKLVVDKKSAKTTSKDAFSKKDNVNDETRKDSE